MRWLALVLLLAITGCGTSLPLSLQPGAPVRVVALGVNSRECVIEPSSEKYRQLDTWLSQNRRGWSQLYSTPPGGGVLVFVGDIRLQLFGTSAFATTTQGVLTKSVNESSYAFLIC